MAVAVVVQRMVNAQASGVMFTVDPVSGLDSAITINSAWGLGEAVVGGDVTPDTVVIDRRSGRVVKQRTGAKTVMTVRATGGTALAPVPESCATVPACPRRRLSGWPGSVAGSRPSSSSRWTSSGAGPMPSCSSCRRGR